MKTLDGHTVHKKIFNQTSVELLFAIFIAALASAAAFSTLLFCPNDVYPLTDDAMGHLTKVRYLAACFSRFEFPSWCPFWYNGSTMMQYYPPLSYMMMAPIEMMVHNVTLTYKIFCFSVLFIGGLGIWAFSRKLIGKWCGLFGIVVYCLQPFLTRSLFSKGVLAQAPVFAISSWYILVVLLYAKKPSRIAFFFSTILTFLLIMSHAMHAFMMCLCIMLVLFVFVLMREINLRDYFSLGVSMALGALLAGFWWMVGVTGFENPGIPYLLEEAGLQYTATWAWFLTGEGTKAGLIFGLPISIACIGSVFLYIISKISKKDSEHEGYYILYNIGLTFFTMIFSFGQHVPLFRLVPLYKSLVPGRILSLTAVSAAILCSYLLHSIYRFSVSKHVIIKISSFLCCLFIITLIVYRMNPYHCKGKIIDVNESYKKSLSMLIGSGAAFDKGRYEWIAPVNCAETYFPVQYGFNTSDGWNIEGTPHNRSIWRYNIALSSACENYVVKDMLFWNVRSIVTLIDRTRLRDALENSIYDFQYEKDKNDFNTGVLYTSQLPSSYFLMDQRNVLTVGKGSPGIAMEFPYMVKNNSDDITSYRKDELARYRLIYISEPPIVTLKQAKQFEETVQKLVQNGAMVIIEPSNAQTIPLFGVSAYDIQFEDDPQLIREPSAVSQFTVENIHFQESGMTRALSGLDEIYYKLHENDGRLTSDIIGAKNIDGGNVYFIGMHLSQYLKACNIWIYGNSETTYTPYAESVKAILNDFINQVPIHKDFTPEAFPVQNSSWNYQGGSFEYYSDRDQQITVSVTYSPRWNVKVDDRPIDVKDRENLIVLDLPAGEHKVVLHYGITKYGMIGYGITGVSILILVLYLIFFERCLIYPERKGRLIANYLGIELRRV